MRAVQFLLRDRLIRAKFAVDRGAVEVVRLDWLGPTIGLDARKEVVPTPAANRALDPERLGVRANGHVALFTIERKRHGNVRRLRPFLRLGGRFLARQDLPPGDQACIAAVSRTQLERGHNPARHELMRKVAMVGFGEVRKPAFAQDSYPLVVELVDQATVVRRNVVLLLVGPIDEQIRLPGQQVYVMRKPLEAAADERMEIIKRKVAISPEQLEYFDIPLGEPGHPWLSPAIKHRLAVPAGVSCRFEFRGIHAVRIPELRRVGKRPPRGTRVRGDAE